MPTITLNVTKEHRGSSLILDCTINCFQDYHNQIKSKIFGIDSLGTVQLNFSYDKDDQMMSVQLHSRRNCSNVKMNLSCSELGYSGQKWIDNKTSFEEILVLSSTSSCDTAKLFRVKLNITMVKEEPKLNVYDKFYKDTELVDFKLYTADKSGYIGVHKLILSASSEVFKTELSSGEWKEKSTGTININAVTVHTLKHLKDFMYLGVLSDEGLYPLLLLGQRYLIHDLKKQCIQRLTQTVTSKNLYSVLEFACRNNMPDLSFALLCTTPSSTVHDVYLYRKNKKLETDW